jgi:hypothetical protein
MRGIALATSGSCSETEPSGKPRKRGSKPSRRADALLFHGAQLHWHAVRDAVDAPQEARGRALEDAVEECRPLHESTSSATYVSRRYISNPHWCASCPAQTSIVGNAPLDDEALDPQNEIWLSSCAS